MVWRNIWRYIAIRAYSRIYTMLYVLPGTGVVLSINAKTRAEKLPNRALLA